MLDNLALYFGLPTLGLLTFLIIGLSISAVDKERRTLTLKLAIGLCFSIGCLVLSLTNMVGNEHHVLALTIGLLNAPNLILLWLFIRSLFEDNFRLGVFEWGVGSAYLLLMIWERLTDANLTTMPLLVLILQGLFSLGLISHLGLSLLKDWQTDLVDRRRKSRLWIVSVLILSGLVSIFAQNGVDVISAEISRIVSLISIAAATLAISVFCAAPDLRKLSFDNTQCEEDIRVALSGRDKLNYDKLVAFMEKEKAYLDPTLTIKKLARELGLAEHALRSLINLRLGFRNYTDFINQYRIAYAKTAFKDPDSSHVPILTIALDSGYSSISAFNRAFRRIEGMTPSEFKKQQKSL